MFTKSDFGRYMVNSLIVATVASTIATLISLLSAYVLARSSSLAAAPSWPRSCSPR
ncbi:hypothetical protein NHF46_14625 [Arthrobacter alpinus]|nr:hypothetical protein [Arthrobacter alpinus]